MSNKKNVTNKTFELCFFYAVTEGKPEYQL